jgi:hypothetical protein
MSGRKRRFDAALAEEDDGTLVAPVADESWEQHLPEGSWKDTATDAAGAWANGVFQGVGINPAEVLDATGGQELGDRLRMKLQTGRQASPYAAGLGDFTGELTSQVASGLGPLAGGALSGWGNTEGDLATKATGAAVGGAMGKAGGMLTGKLSSLLREGSEAAGRSAMNKGLEQSGAEAADLRRLDQLGGREYFAEGAQRLGLTGRPGKVLTKAEKLAQQLEEQRAGLVGDAPPDIDPRALGASVRGAADRYPGITPVANAADNAAGYVDNIDRGGRAGWDDVNAQRKYWGDKTNFASGTPEANMRKGVYGAYNDEMGDALSLRDAGAGDAWRQAGRDEQIAIELGDIASKGVDRARGREFSLTGTPARLLGDMVNGPGPAKLSAALQGGGSKLAGAFPAGVAGGNAGAATADQVLDALQNSPQLLGRYTDQFAQAAGSPSPGAVSALIERLTMTDPDFRTQVLPQLSRPSGGY